jgi:hypothetical protein
LPKLRVGKEASRERVGGERQRRLEASWIFVGVDLESKPRASVGGFRTDSPTVVQAYSPAPFPFPFVFPYPSFATS